jgi:hypothetical protein
MIAKPRTRPDLARVTHYTLKVLPNGYGYPRCAQGPPRANVTTDLAEVTCKGCRKSLGLPPEAAS